MLAILATHPIQYQVPIWRHLAERANLPLQVFYLSQQGQAHNFDPGFGREVTWDIDLLSGYPHEFVPAILGTRQDSIWWLRLPRGFGEELRRRGVTVLWVQGWQVVAYWQAIVQAQRAGIQVWVRGDTTLRSGTGGLAQWARRRVLERLLARVDRFLTVGAANRDFYRSLGVDEARMIAAPHCVDNARFREAARQLAPSRQALRREWGIPDDAFCFLFAGKFVGKKRPLDLVEGVRRLRERRPDRPVHVLWVGTGELRAEVEASVASAGVPSSFAGFLNQSEISRAYVAADALVLPSDGTETWGLVVNEAMASSLPCVVSSQCGCAEDLVLPLRPDLCFEMGDASALCASLEAVLDDPLASELLSRHVDQYDVACTAAAVAAAFPHRPEA